MSHRPSWSDHGWVWLAAALAFLLRTLPFLGSTFRGRPWPEFFDGDVFYHLRRIELTARHWPVVPDFDAWLSYPDGAYAIWAPLFDFVPATVVRFTGWPAYAVASFYVPALAALVSWPLYRLLQATFGVAAARWGVLLHAVLPGALLVGVVGRIDHHVAEVLMQLSASLLALRLMDAHEHFLRAGMRLGIAMGLALLTWAGSLAFLCVPAAALGIHLLALRDTQRAAQLARAAGAAFALAALVPLPYAGLNAARGRPAFESYSLSLLQPAVLLACAAALVAAAFIAAPFHRGEVKRGAQRAGLVALTLALPFAYAPLRDGLLAGMAFVTRSESTWLSHIVESQSPLTSLAAYRFMIEQVGYGPLVLLFCAVASIVRVWRERGQRAGSVLAATWIAHALALMFFQQRFVAYAAPLIAATPGIAHALLAQRRTLATAASGLALLMLVPAAGYWRPLLNGHPESLSVFWTFDTSTDTLLDAIATRTPAAGDVMDTRTRPAYCVFAPWDLGHYLIERTQRAPVATPFGTHLPGDGYAEQEQLYERIEDEATALALLDRRGCRYLVTHHLSRGPGAAHAIYAQRLHRARGSDFEGGAGSGHMRLRFESPPDPDLDNDSFFRLYERVAGAVVQLPGSAPHGLVLRTTVELDGKRFAYERKVEGGSGRAVTLAHPGRYVLLASGAILGEIEISDDAVRSGRTLRLAERPSAAAEAADAL